MKNVFKKIAIASALVAASSSVFADEIGNVQVDVNYVSTCTVINAPTATFTDIVPGTFPSTDVTIDFECSASSDVADVTLWLASTRLYAEDTAHHVFFVNQGVAIDGLVPITDAIADFVPGFPADSNPNGNSPVTSLTPGTNTYSVTVTAALGKRDGSNFSAPEVYDTVSLQVPVNIEF